jgi:hypothetical protein
LELPEPRGFKVYKVYKAYRVFREIMVLRDSRV